MSQEQDWSLLENPHPARRPQGLWYRGVQRAPDTPTWLQDLAKGQKRGERIPAEQAMGWGVFRSSEKFREAEIRVLGGRGPRKQARGEWGPGQLAEVLWTMTLAPRAVGHPHDLLLKSVPLFLQPCAWRSVGPSSEEVKSSG